MLRTAAGVAAVVLAAFGLQLWRKWGGDTVTQTLDNLVQMALALLGGGAALWTGLRARGRLRRSWVLVGAGLVSWAFGQAVWTGYELSGTQTPFPSAADVGYLGFPLLATLGLWVYPGSSGGVRSRLPAALDGCIVMLSLLAVSWTTTMRAVWKAAGGEDVLALTISLAYPATDVLMCTMALLALARARSRHRLPLVLVAVGLVCMGVSDSAFAYAVAQGTYAPGLGDLGWASAFCLVGLGALAEDTSRVAEPAAGESGARWHLVLPYVPTLLCLAVVGHQALLGPGIDALQVGIGTLLLAVVLLRQFLVLADNQRLVLAVQAGQLDLRHQAFHDPLTGLPNRAQFSERLHAALHATSGTGRPVALLYLDLDDFKQVNDTLGHDAGDELLRGVAERLRACVRPGDTVARLGGDEFAMLLQEGAPHAEEVAERVVAALREPFILGERHVPARASIGLAVAGGASGEVPGLEELLRRADTAMYDAKSRGKGRLAVFSLDLHREVVEERALRTDLLDALASGELSVAYQPALDVRTGVVTGVEALARWDHPRLGAVPAERLVRIAENAGFVARLDTYVLRRALDEMGGWLRDDRTTAPLGVNVSGGQLGDGLLAGRVAEALAAADVAPRRLVVEITESAITGDVDQAVAEVDALRRLGVRVAIDDFGTGYSSLAHLHRFPVDQLKIDKSFVGQLGGAGAGLVDVVVSIGRTLGLATVAEGVETADQLASLSLLGCGSAQGYLFCHPMPAADLYRWLAACRPGPDADLPPRPAAAEPVGPPGPPAAAGSAEQVSGTPAARA